MSSSKYLFIEPFYGGSHKQLLDTILTDPDFSESGGYELFTLPAKKWHWRARTSALYFAENIPTEHSYKVLFASSVLNLAELVALRSDLRDVRKILYFHENQLEYPVQKAQDRDFQYGYNQILSCLVSDVVLFNSEYNMHSFLNSINKFFKTQPDHRPKHVVEKIRPKAKVIYFPIRPLSIPRMTNEELEEKEVLHIVWPHRWEHDKDPESFFHAIFKLMESECRFHLSVLGEQFSEVPSIFDEAKIKLESYQHCQVINWGFVPRDVYVETLSEAHIVVSTAIHEFFGVSMIESALLGCYPLAPNRLSYPEIFPDDCLYNTEAQLVKKLRYFRKNPAAARKMRPPLTLERFLWDNLRGQYQELLFS